MGDPGRKVVDVGGIEVGMFRLGNDILAYENRCPHLEGPCVSGKNLAARARSGSWRRHQYRPRLLQTADECRMPVARLRIRYPHRRTIRPIRACACASLPVRVTDGEVFVTVPAAKAVFFE